MNAKEREELQRQLLYVQLKILKELRIMNRNYNSVHMGDKSTSTFIHNRHLEDVETAIALTGFNFV